MMDMHACKLHHVVVAAIFRKCLGFVMVGPSWQHFECLLRWAHLQCKSHPTSWPLSRMRVELGVSTSLGWEKYRDNRIAQKLELGAAFPRELEACNKPDKQHQKKHWMPNHVTTNSQTFCKRVWGLKFLVFGDWWWFLLACEPYLVEHCMPNHVTTNSANILQGGLGFEIVLEHSCLGCAFEIGDDSYLLVSPILLAELGGSLLQTPMSLQRPTS